MATEFATAFGFGVVGLVLVTVLGAVERPEKFAFVAGVLLLVAGPLLVGRLAVPEAVGAFVALAGVLVVVASTVPLLRQSLPAT